MKTHRTSIAEIDFNEEERILHIKILEGAEMNLKNAQEHYEKINDLLGSKKYFALVDAKNYYPIEKDAWLYASSKEVVSNRIAVAQYNSSLGNTITTKFFKSTLNTLMPVEIFDTKEDALKWLKTIAI